MAEAKKYILEVISVIPSGITTVTATTEYDLTQEFSGVTTGGTEFFYSTISLFDLSIMSNSEYLQRVSDFLAYVNVDSLYDRDVLYLLANYDEPLCSGLPTTTTTTLAPTTTTTTTLAPTTTTTTLPPYTFYLSGYMANVAKTTNGGVSWSNVSVPSSTASFFSSDYVNDTGYVLAAGSSKLYKTINGGTSWSDLSATLPLNSNSIFAINENTLLIGNKSTNVDLYKSTNGGVSWTPITKVVEMSMDYFRFVSPLIGYAIDTKPSTGTGSGTIIAKTTDGGNTWTDITAPSMGFFGTYFDASFLSSGVGYIGTGNSIFKTIDGGATWTAPVTYPGGSFFFYGIKVFNSGVVILCGPSGSDNVIARSTNGGSTWTLTTIPSAGNGTILNAHEGTPMAFFNDNVGIIPLIGVSTTKTLITIDNGVTWSFGGDYGLSYPNHFNDVKAAKNPIT